MDNSLLTNEEIDFLADNYIKLKKNKTYKKLSKNFKNFIKEYLDEQFMFFLKKKNRQQKIGRKGEQNNG